MQDLYRLVQTGLKVMGGWGGGGAGGGWTQ